jgi:arginine repressor
MPETLDLFNEVRLLRAELENQGELVNTLLRTQGAEAARTIVSRLRSDALLSEIYLAIDGKRSQGEILELLRTRGLAGANAATVSRRFDLLANDLGLIVLVGRTKRGKVYRRTAVDKALGISRALSRGG